MPYSRSRLDDNEDELPESDDELIMSVLNDLGIQERPDVETRYSSYLEVSESDRSSLLDAAERSPQWCSFALSEASDGWTIVSTPSIPHRCLYKQDFTLHIQSIIPTKSFSKIASSCSEPRTQPLI
jgi:hypothetical protein